MRVRAVTVSGLLGFALFAGFLLPERLWDNLLSNVPKYASEYEVPNGGYPIYLEKPAPGSNINPHEHAATPDLQRSPAGLLERGDLDIATASKAIEKALVQKRTRLFERKRLKDEGPVGDVLISQQLFREYVKFRLNETLPEFCADWPVSLNITGGPERIEYLGIIPVSAYQGRPARYVVGMTWDTPRMPPEHRKIVYDCRTPSCACDPWPQIDPYRPWKPHLKPLWPTRVAAPIAIASQPSK